MREASTDIGPEAFTGERWPWVDTVEAVSVSLRFVSVSLMSVSPMFVSLMSMS